jgi:hypothetical protein
MLHRPRRISHRFGPFKILHIGSGIMISAFIGFIVVRDCEAALRVFRLGSRSDVLSGRSDENRHQFAGSEANLFEPKFVQFVLGER